MQQMTVESVGVMTVSTLRSPQLVRGLRGWAQHKCTNDASSSGSRISVFELREADIQIESANRLNLFSYFVLCDRHRREVALRNSKEIG